MAEDQPATASGSGRPIKFYFCGVLLTVSAIVAVGYFHVSRSQSVAVAREARANIVDRGPRIEVVAAAQGPTERTNHHHACGRPREFDRNHLRQG